MTFFNQRNKTEVHSPTDLDCVTPRDSLGWGSWLRPLTSGMSGRAIIALLWGLMSLSGVVSAQDSSSDSSGAQTSLTESSDAEPATIVVPEQMFVPDFDDQDLAGSEERAWEFRPYRVAVWFCLDGSPGLNSTYKKMATDVTRLSELLDPSGWDLSTGRAPEKWRNLFLRFVETPEKLAGFAELSSLDGFDKIMIVCLQDESGSTHIRVREYDIQTQQWGPLLLRDVSRKSELGASVMDAISVAFMPLARIDRVTEIAFLDAAGKRKVRDEVVMQIRSIRSCLRTELNELMEWTVQPIEGSPVYIKTDDRFLPVIRRTDRNGDLKSLDPIEFTFLTINDVTQTPPQLPAPNINADSDSDDNPDSDDQEAGPATAEDEAGSGKAKASVSDNIAVLRCSIQSNRRAPLSQRKSKHAQKLALVIRPPQRSTRLYLYSRDKERTPLEGFEVWSRRPTAMKGDSNEFLGKTDWEGSLEIPPSPDGLRVILIKRGSRALVRLPIMPGLYDSVETDLPNDETRLYAEGVISGLRNEILSLVIRRTVFEEEIEAALKAKDREKARASFDDYRNLETLTDLKTRLSENLVQLKIRTSDPGELKFINLMFDSLRSILNKQMTNSKKSGLQEQIQAMIAESQKKVS